MTMAQIQLYNLEGKAVGSVPVPEGLEGPANEARLWQATRSYLANQRQGNADTKRRGEVSGGGRKPWKQKHTGRARAGSIRSPIWRKGGVVFGPHPREYRYALSPRVRRAALRDSLKEKFTSQSVAVVETFEGIQPKTKALVGFLKGLNAEEGALLVVDKPSASLVRISRNLRDVLVRLTADLTCYEVLASRKVVLTTQALKQLEQWVPFPGVPGSAHESPHQEK